MEGRGGGRVSVCFWSCWKVVCTRTGEFSGFCKILLGFGIRLYRSDVSIMFNEP